MRVNMPCQYGKVLCSAVFERVVCCDGVSARFGAVFNFVM